MRSRKVQFRHWGNCMSVLPGWKVSATICESLRARVGAFTAAAALSLVMRSWQSQRTGIRVLFIAPYGAHWRPPYDNRRYRRPVFVRRPICQCRFLAQLAGELIEPDF